MKRNNVYGAVLSAIGGVRRMWTSDEAMSENKPSAPWRPSLDGTEDDPWMTAIYQAVGTASMCWIEQDGERVFDSERAQWITDGLRDWIDDRVEYDPYWAADPVLARVLKMLNDEFGMLGVLRTQQAAFDYAEGLRGEPEPPQWAEESRCEAVLNIKGEHFPCQTLSYMVDADGTPATSHEGWAHSNADAEAIWHG